MTPRSPKRASSSGFTLAEVLVTTLVMGIALAAIFGYLSGGLQSVQTTQSHGEALQTAQGLVNRISRELRQAQHPDPSQPAVTELTANRIAFYVDSNRTPGAVPAPKLVRYTFGATGGVTREERTPPSTAWTAPITIARGVSGVAVPFDATTPSPNYPSTPVFRGFGDVANLSTADTGPELPSPVTNFELISSIDISLKVDQKSGSATTTTEVATNVVLRNRLLH